MNPLHVFGLGSCRILTPLQHLAKMQAITLAHKGTAWYIHSPQDTLQKIEIITGRKTIPPEHVTLVTTTPENFLPEFHRPDIFDGVDLFMIEISSLKSFKLDDLEIQQWRVRDIVAESGISATLFDKATRSPIEGRDLSFVPDNATPLARALAERGQLRYQTPEEITGDLDRIVQTLGPDRRFIWVPPIHVETLQGELLPDRATLVDTLASFATSRNHGFFNPAPHVRTFGRENAIKDMGHYTAPFEPVIAGRMLDLLWAA